MTGIGENAYTPLMHQDLASSSFGMMSYPMMGMGYGMGMGMPAIQRTTYLNGTKMKSQAESDEFLKRQDEQDKKDLSLLKKALLVFGGCVLLGFIPPLRKSIKNAGGIGKFCSNQWNKVVNWAKNLF